MGDLNTTGEESTEQADQAEAGNTDQEETQTGDGADTDDQEESASDDDNATEEDSEEEKEEKPDSKPDVDEEPKTRKRNVDFIIERKNRKIEKLKNKEEANEDEEDDDIDPDDAKIIGKQVEKYLSPFIAKQMEEEDTQEINTFVKDNPDFAPYIDRVKKFAQHPSRKDMPIKSIFYEVAGDDLLKIGAKRAQKANEEAKESSAGGGSSQGDTTEKSIWDLTPEEFTARQEELRNKPRE